MQLCSALDGRWLCAGLLYRPVSGLHLGLEGSAGLGHLTMCRGNLVLRAIHYGGHPLTSDHHLLGGAHIPPLQLLLPGGQCLVPATDGLLRGLERDQGLLESRLLTAKLLMLVKISLTGKRGSSLLGREVQRPRRRR